tara:strand:+ start:109 stop:717 length:609 start_codon:yes stop_codon:yes gene_type:complete
MKNIVIINYGYGNTYSLNSALSLLGYNALVTNKPDEICKADIIFLPGVGAFKQAMNAFLNLHMLEALNLALKRGSILIGICLGYQMLFEESEEFGVTKGLGLLKGKVVRLNHFNNLNNRIPNVGWFPLINNLNNNKLEDKTVYFVHSYVPIVKEMNIISSFISYGNDLIHSSIDTGQIIGFQFHPEKSGKDGIKILSSILEG